MFLVNLACKYKGFVGAIRSIDAHPTKPIFVSCGIDRFVIAHDLNTRKVLKKVFIKIDVLIFETSITGTSKMKPFK